MKLFKKLLTKNKRKQVEIQVFVPAPLSRVLPAHKQIPLPLSMMPDNVLIHLIRTIIATESIETASKLIAAFPEQLAQFVLIVSDSPLDHLFLVEHMPKAVKTISLLELCDKPWDDRRLIPIRILSFSEPESFAISYYLNNLTSCPYARFMTPLTPVIIEVYSTTGMSYQLIHQHAKSQGVQVFETKLSYPYEYAELDGLYDKPPASNVSVFDPHYKFTPVLYREKRLTRFAPKGTVTLLDIVNYDNFKEDFYFSKLQILRARYDSKCRDNDCSPKGLTLVSGALDSFCVSFSNALGVAIDDTKAPEAPFGESNGRGMFMLINQSWSYKNPYGRKLCGHHAEAGIQDQATMITAKSSNVLRFTKTFSDFYLVGVPDMTLLNCAMNWALHIRWKRLTPLKNSERVIEGPHVLRPHCCTHLTIFNKIHENDIDQNPMTVFEVPSIQSLSLFALEGSQEPWSLDLALKVPSVLKYLIVIHMSTLEVSSESKPPMIIHGQALAMACDYLEELHIMGYTPGFCLLPRPRPLLLFLNDTCFHKLDFIRIDVTSIPRVNDNIDLSFPQSRFPSLLTVCFDLYDDMNISGNCPPTTTVTIHTLPDNFIQVNINTMIRSQFVICGRRLAPFDGEVKLGNFVVWKLKDDVWKATEILKEKNYKQWVYEQ